MGSLLCLQNAIIIPLRDLCDVKVKLRVKALRIEGHKQFQGNSTHWHHDSFEVTWDQARLGKTIITFELDVMGNVKGVEIPGKGFHSR